MPSSRAPPRRPPPPSESSIKRAILLREARKEKKNYLQRKGEERVKSPIRKHQSFYQVRPNLLQQLEEQNAVEDETYQSIEPLKSEPFIENGDPAAINPNHRFSTNLISKTSKTTKNIKSSLVAKAGKIKKKYLSPRKSPTLDGAQEQVQPASPPQQPVDTGGVYDDAFDDSIYSGIDDVTIGEYGEIEDVGNQQFTAEEGIYLTADM